MKRVAVNGMGRIGRLVVRALLERENVELVAVNDIASMATIAYLLAHSTEHGALGANIAYDEEAKALVIGGKPVIACCERDASKLPWKELAVDVVIECSGAYCSRSKAQAHLDAGAKKVLISAAAGSDVPTVVYGINDSILTDADKIVSGASCSTVGLAPFAKAVGLVLPELQGRLSGYAIRVPVTRGSLITLYAVVSYEGEGTLDADKLNELMRAHENEAFGYTDEELVSSDIAGTNLYSIFDATQTKVSPLENGYLVETAAWFDNETSYVSHFVQLLRLL